MHADLIVGLRAGQVTPLLHYTAEINRVEWNKHRADLVVLREPIEVEDVKHQRLGTDFCIRHLQQHRS